MAGSKPISRKADAHDRADAARQSLLLAAVFGAVAAAIALFTYGFVRTTMIVWQTFAGTDLSSKGGKLLMVAFIEVFDLFLLDTVLLIMGVSLYTLFVDEKVKLPACCRSTASTA